MMETRNSAIAILEQALELADARGDGWRIVSESTTAAKLDALLTEIGGAIMPRKIRAEIGAARYTITANSGRLVKSDQDINNIYPQDSRETRLGRVAKQLAEFAGSDGVLRLWAEPVAEASDTDEIGLSQGELRGYCQAAGYLSAGSTAQAGGDEVASSFDDALGTLSHTSALISPGSGVAVISGDPEDLCEKDALLAIAGKLAALPVGHPLGAGAWIVGHGPDDSNQIAGVVVDPENATFHAGAVDDLPMLVRKWEAKHADLSQDEG